MRNPSIRFILLLLRLVATFLLQKLFLAYFTLQVTLEMKQIEFDRLLLLTSRSMIVILDKSSKECLFSTDKAC